MSVVPPVHGAGRVFHRHPGVLGAFFGVFTALVLVAVGMVVGLVVGLACVTVAAHLGLPVPTDTGAILRQLVP